MMRVECRRRDGHLDTFPCLTKVHADGTIDWVATRLRAEADALGLARRVSIYRTVTLVGGADVLLRIGL